MTKVVIIKQPYDFGFEFMKVRAGIPLRHAYLAAILEKNKIEYDILDLNLKSIKKFRGKHNNLAKSLNPLRNKFSYLTNKEYGKKRLFYLNWVIKECKAADKYDYVMINGDNPLSMSILKSITTKKIVGGNKATLSPDIFKSFADYICLGHCDEVLPQILNGSVNQGVISCNCREILTPNYNKIDLKEYFKIFNYAPLITSLGCPHKCSYCTFKGKSGYICRSIKDVAHEIKVLKKQGITNFLFTDNHLNLDKNRLKELMQHLIPLKINWMGMFRPENLDKQTIELISNAGCILASFGLETPIERIRDKVRKKINTKEAAEILKKFKTFGIGTRISFLYGLPKESLSDFWSIKKFVANVKPDLYFLHELQLVKGTEIYDHAEKFFNVIYRNEKPEIVRLYNEMLEHKTKQILAKYSNMNNQKKWEKRYRRFHYVN